MGARYFMVSLIEMLRCRLCTVLPVFHLEILDGESRYDCLSGVFQHVVENDLHCCLGVEDNVTVFLRSC